MRPTTIKAQEMKTSSREAIIQGITIYQCAKCNNTELIYCEEGIEDLFKESKPSPFEITCPNCGGIMTEREGCRRLPRKRSVRDGEKYFANESHMIRGQFTIKTTDNAKVIEPRDVKVLKHSLGVARKMREMALSEDNENEAYADDMFILGFLHEIGKEITHIGMTPAAKGGFALMRQGYKYWEEIVNHERLNTTYDSKELDMLNIANLTINEDGKEVSVSERLNEIKKYEGKDRYEEARRLAKKLSKLYSEEL